LTAEFAADALSAVPEVSTWAMMLIGFAGLGFASYRSRHHGLGRGVIELARRR
jgi:hypothetical protein